MPIQPGTRLGPYEVVSAIGAGGMGEVWRARDPRLGRDVAVKVLPASFSADADRLRRFEQEARAAGILNHPNITAVLDIGEHEGAPYVVQELLEGETLRQALAGGLSPRKAIDFAVQIAHGLAAAHEKGIVHRDLKPENIFVTRDGRVKILDFGLAKLTRPESDSQATNMPTATAGTEPGMVLGTLGYMAPEQVRGRPADARSDIFSFGAILYEMLAGQRAFRGDSAADTMSAILKEDPPDLSVTNQNIAPGLERIVRHCLEKNAEQRFQSARDLAFDLEALSGDSSPARKSETPTERPARRSQVPIAVAIAAALALAAAAYLAGTRSRPGGRGAEVEYLQLTFKHQPVFTGRFAPDGRTLVFSSAPSGNDPVLFSWRPDSAGPVVRGPKGIHLLSISSRGELAVLTKVQYVRHRMFVGTLARMPLEGGAPREIAEQIREADWSPDGAELAVTRNVNGRDRLEFPLGKVLAETGGYFSDLRFSPDGKRIAFFEHPIRFDDRGSVDVIDLAGKKTRLSDGYWAEEGLAWSLDGREVIFSAGLGYNMFKIFAVDLSGHRRTALESAGGLTILDVSKDHWLTSRDDFFRDMLVRAPNAQQETDLSWLEQSYPSAFTRDGKTLLFTEESPTAGPYYSTCIRSSDGAAVVRLGDGTAEDISPDGKWALSVIPTNPDKLVVYPTGTGQPRTIASGGVVTYEFAQFFPGAERVFFCGHENGKGVRCYVQGIADAKPRPITPEGTTDGVVSPDGRRVCVRSNGGLQVFPAEGGPGLTVPGATGDDTLVRWDPAGNGVLVARGWEVPIQIERVDLATGRRTPFRTVGPPDLTGAIQIFPIVFADNATVYGYGARRMHSDVFLVSGAH